MDLMTSWLPEAMTLHRSVHTQAKLSPSAVKPWLQRLHLVKERAACLPAFPLTTASNGPTCISQQSFSWLQPVHRKAGDRGTKMRWGTCWPKGGSSCCSLLECGHRSEVYSFSSTSCSGASQPSGLRLFVTLLWGVLVVRAGPLGPLLLSFLTAL